MIAIAEPFIWARPGAYLSQFETIGYVLIGIIFLVLGKFVTQRFTSVVGNVTVLHRVIRLCLCVASVFVSNLHCYGFCLLNRARTCLYNWNIVHPPISFQLFWEVFMIDSWPSHTNPFLAGLKLKTDEIKDALKSGHVFLVGIVSSLFLTGVIAAGLPGEVQP